MNKPAGWQNFRRRWKQRPSYFTNIPNKRDVPHFKTTKEYGWFYLLIYGYREFVKKGEIYILGWETI